MPQPGLSRAIPMGILGFAIGALLVLAIRAAQGLDPVWNPGVGMVLAAFFSAGFFVWGMGGFDPRMSVHGEEAHDDTHADVTPSPLALNSSITWKLTTLLILVGLVIFVIAAVPFGPALTITDVPEASLTSVGYTDLELFGIEIPQVSQLTLFIAFVVIMMLSLFVVAGGLGWLFFSASKGIANAAVVEHTPMGRQLFELPSGATEQATAEQPKASGLPASLSIPVFLVVAIVGFLVTYFVIMPIVSGNILAGIVPIAEDTRLFFSIAAGLAAGAAIGRPRGNLMFWAVFLAFAAFLYPIFYHVAIGLVYLAFPSIGPITAEFQRVLLSIVNALLIPLIVLRPKWITFAAGRAARILANFLRWVGTVK
jgi:hypothetical protein